MEAAPAAAEYVPAAQSVHFSAPPVDHVPDGHVVQLLAPCNAYVPAKQAVQVPALGTKPPLQGTQKLEALPRVTNPGPQGEQEDAPTLLKVPITQS